MKETITGTVQGEYARRYPSHTYRKPVQSPLTPHELYADRVYWDRAYPRWTEGFPLKPIKYVELADYSITTQDHPLHANAILAKVWVQPNQYTAAKDAMLVREIVIRLELFLVMREDWLRDELIREAFAPPRATDSFTPLQSQP